MRSSDLARLAHTSVRALRHYHHVGVLPEPPRSRNGYREYRVTDLVRVLQIRRLATMGVPLDHMVDVLENTGRADSLDELDRQLELQIEELQSQRSALAAVRAHGGAPDVPAQLAALIDTTYRGQELGNLEELDRGVMLLLDAVTDGKATSLMAGLIETLSTPESIARGQELAQRFAHIDENPHDADALVAESVAFTRAMLASVEESDLDLTGTEAASLLATYQRESLTSLQLELSLRIVEGFD